MRQLQGADIHSSSTRAPICSASSVRKQRCSRMPVIRTDGGWQTTCSYRQYALQPSISSISISNSRASRCTSTSSSSSRCRRMQQQHICRASSGSDPSGSGSSASNPGTTSSGAAVADVEPFTEEQLQELAEYERSLEEEGLGIAWRSEFADDIDGLYDYVDRDQLEFAARLRELKATPQHLWEAVGLMDKVSKYPPGLVADMMGMGSWRLKGILDEVFSFLVSRIEGSLREILDTDLALYPADKWKSKGWDFIDSLDPKREWGGFSYVDMPSPLKGMEGYPRLLIENRVYSSRVFRKLHLEVAYRQDGLQVLHMVFYPRYDFDIPILAFDLVAAGGAISLAIIDACPVTDRLTLPSHYAETMLELQQHFLPESCHERRIPEWGSKIFSPLCVCIRPDEPEELGGFMKYAVALTRAHLMYSNLLDPLEPMDKPSLRRISELLSCHQRFCEQQLANTKTARVLETAFNGDFTEQYMKQLMFDYTPREDVPWFDGSLAKLYDYFEETPEVWANAEEFMKTRLKLDEQKASEYLRRFLSGDQSIKLPRLSFALQHMYDSDPDFQCAVDRSLEDKDPASLPVEDEMGEYLAQQLMDLVHGQHKEAAMSANAASQQAGSAAQQQSSNKATEGAEQDAAAQQQEKQDIGGPQQQPDEPSSS